VRRRAEIYELHFGNGKAPPRRKEEGLTQEAKEWVKKLAKKRKSREQYGGGGLPAVLTNREKHWRTKANQNFEGAQRKSITESRR